MELSSGAPGTGLGQGTVERSTAFEGVRIADDWFSALIVPKYSPSCANPLTPSRSGQQKK